MIERTHSEYRNWRWWTVALRGLAAIVFGILAIASPASAFVTLVIVFGVYAIIDGVLALALGARPGLVPRSAMIARGLVSIIAGLIALFMPGVTSLVLVMVIAAWAVVAGIFEIVMAIRMRHQLEHEWLLGIEGALSVVFGVLLFISPVAGAIAIGLWVGAYALILGGMEIASGLRLREHEHDAAALPHAVA